MLSYTKDLLHAVLVDHLCRNASYVGIVSLYWKSSKLTVLAYVLLMLLSCCFWDINVCIQLYILYANCWHLIINSIIIISLKFSLFCIITIISFILYANGRFKYNIHSWFQAVSNALDLTFLSWFWELLGNL